MERISQWPQFLSVVGPFLASSRPLEAMERAGILLTENVAAAMARGKPTQSFPHDLVAELKATYGPAPSMRVFVGRDRPPDLPPTPSASGYDLITSVFTLRFLLVFQLRYKWLSQEGILAICQCCLPSR